MNKLIQGVLLCGVTIPAFGAEPITSVVISEEIPFSNKEAVDPRVVAECNLPQRQAEFLGQALTAVNVEFKTVKNLDSTSGDSVLELEIQQTGSGHIPFVGRYKSVTVVGKLYQHGKQVAALTAKRNSTGGGFGAFKGACAIFYGSAQAIGQDIARWMVAPTDDAKLGDAR